MRPNESRTELAQSYQTGPPRRSRYRGKRHSPFAVSWIGVIPLVTGLVSWCPAYTILGVRTCKPSAASWLPLSNGQRSAPKPRQEPSCQPLNQRNAAAFCRRLAVRANHGRRRPRCKVAAKPCDHRWIARSCQSIPTLSCLGRANYRSFRSRSEGGGGGASLDRPRNS